MVTRFSKSVSLFFGLAALLGMSYRAMAQSSGPKFVVDPTWPKPLPEN
jgi:hypothetical protein